MEQGISTKRVFRLNLSEIIMVIAGLLFFTSTAFIALGGNFAILLATKAVYLVGLILLLINK
jgi:uncharacterized membrane protein